MGPVAQCGRSGHGGVTFAAKQGEEGARGIGLDPGQRLAFEPGGLGDGVQEVALALSPRTPPAGRGPAAVDFVDVLSLPDQVLGEAPSIAAGPFDPDLTLGPLACHA